MTRFIVVADSHIRFPDDDVDTYPSNAHMLGRNHFVVDMCNQIDGAFVVHLGDIVHPVPAEDAHESAVHLAAGVYSQLDRPIHFVAGNHDIGDKPNAHVAVPPVADEYYRTFEERWGAPFGSFDLDDLHFVVVDTPTLNSGLDRELAQRTWLEADLTAAAGRRIFLFTHYPPFIRDPEENEHYDNLGEPARSWLLDLIELHHVEAVFSGHVHNFLYNHRAGTEFYVLPSTGFVRPDYSELAALPPESENGRDDPSKLGFFVVDVADDGHQIRFIRTGGATAEAGSPPVPLEVSLDPGWESPIGVTLRHGWMTEVDFPTAGLDEFARKTVRNDATIPALWEARINRVRIPVADCARPSQRDRLQHLAGRGARFTVFSAGIPEREMWESIEAVGDAIERWEIAIEPDSFPRLITALAAMAGPQQPSLAVGPIVPVGSIDHPVHHFVSPGFSPRGGGVLERWIEFDADRLVQELVFRVTSEHQVVESIAAAEELAAGTGRKAVVLVELPRATESSTFDNDEAVAERVAKAVEGARSRPGVVVFLDGFMDHDRSYYPRHGLIDRRHNPRPALYRLIETAAGEAQ